MGVPRPLKEPIVCYEVPGCDRRPLRFWSTADYEQHHRLAHWYRCETCRDRRVFPGDFWLQLHLAEFHDPQVAIRRERGEKTVKPERQITTERPTTNLCASISVMLKAGLADLLLLERVDCISLMRTSIRVHSDSILLPMDCDHVRTIRRRVAFDQSSTSTRWTSAIRTGEYYVGYMHII